MTTLPSEINLLICTFLDANFIAMLTACSKQMQGLDISKQVTSRLDRLFCTTPPLSLQRLYELETHLQLAKTVLWNPAILQSDSCSRDDIHELLPSGIGDLYFIDTPPPLWVKGCPCPIPMEFMLAKAQVLLSAGMPSCISKYVFWALENIYEKEDDDGPASDCLRLRVAEMCTRILCTHTDPRYQLYALGTLMRATESSKSVGIMERLHHMVRRVYISSGIIVARCVAILRTSSQCEVYEYKLDALCFLVNIRPECVPLEALDVIATDDDFYQSVLSIAQFEDDSYIKKGNTHTLQLWEKAASLSCALLPFLFEVESGTPRQHPTRATLLQRFSRIQVDLVIEWGLEYGGDDEVDNLEVAIGMLYLQYSKSSIGRKTLCSTGILQDLYYEGCDGYVSIMTDMISNIILCDKDGLSNIKDTRLFEGYFRDITVDTYLQRFHVYGACIRASDALLEAAVQSNLLVYCTHTLTSHLCVDPTHAELLVRMHMLCNPIEHSQSVDSCVAALLTECAHAVFVNNYRAVIQCVDGLCMLASLYSAAFYCIKLKLEDICTDIGNAENRTETMNELRSTNLKREKMLTFADDFAKLDMMAPYTSERTPVLSRLASIG